jgi:polysaccharide biosynthesis/export protein
MNRLLFVIMLISCISLGTTTTASGESYVIGPEDMLQINVWGNQELSAHIPVRPDGMISAPLVGDVKADGLTPAELKAQLEKQYSKFIKSPIVSVIVTAVNSFKVYIVGGGVSGGTSAGPANSTGGGSGSSGVISLKRNTTLLQLLAQLGSLQGADLKSAYILRKGNKMNIDFMKLINEGDSSQDVQLKRDDVIFIPPDLMNRIKVVGAVRTPGIIPYVKGMTALDAVLSVGGFTEFASQNNVVIVRQEGSEVRNIEVRLKDVLRDGDLGKNVSLKPGDIVNVKSGIF